MVTREVMWVVEVMWIWIICCHTNEEAKAEGCNKWRICLYEEQIMELKKMLAIEEHQTQTNSEVVAELRKKIAK